VVVVVKIGEGHKCLAISETRSFAVDGMVRSDQQLGSIFLLERESGSAFRVYLQFSGNYREEELEIDVGTNVIQKNNLCFLGYIAKQEVILCDFLVFGRNVFGWNDLFDGTSKNGFTCSSV